VKTKIYVLCNAGGIIRYVGKTCKNLPTRLSGHLYKARVNGSGDCSKWIGEMLRDGRIPSIVLIGEVDGNGCKEERAWIAYGKAEGWQLTNLTDGGEGGSFLIGGPMCSISLTLRSGTIKVLKQRSSESGRSVSEIADSCIRHYLELLPTIKAGDKK